MKGIPSDFCSLTMFDLKLKSNGSLDGSQGDLGCLPWSNIDVPVRTGWREDRGEEGKLALLHVTGGNGVVAEVAKFERVASIVLGDSGSGLNLKVKGVAESAGGVDVVLDRMRLCRLDPRLYLRLDVLPDPASGGQLGFCAIVSYTS